MDDVAPHPASEAKLPSCFDRGVVWNPLQPSRTRVHLKVVSCSRLHDDAPIHAGRLSGEPLVLFR